MEKMSENDDQDGREELSGKKTVHEAQPVGAKWCVMVDESSSMNGYHNYIQERREDIPKQRAQRLLLVPLAMKLDKIS